MTSADRDILDCLWRVVRVVAGVGRALDARSPSPYWFRDPDGTKPTARRPKPERTKDFRRHAVAISEWVLAGGDPKLLDFYDRMSFAAYFFELRRAESAEA